MVSPGLLKKGCHVTKHLRPASGGCFSIINTGEEPVPTSRRKWLQSLTTKGVRKSESSLNCMNFATDCHADRHPGVTYGI